MLSDNSIVYILYTLFLIIIVPIFLRICASTFTGGDVEAKSPIQNIVQNAAHNEQLDKILDVDCISYNLAASSFGCAGIP